MVIPNALHTSSIQMIGIVNSLKTGDPTVDTLLAIFVPYLLSKIMNDLQRYLRQWLNSMKKKTFRKTYDRVIVYDSNENAQTGSPYNSYLIKGILRYMHKHCELDMSTAELCLSLADQNMAQNAQQKNAALRARARRTSNNSTLDILQIAELTEKPVVGQFIPVGTFESSLVLVKLQDSSREKKKQDENDNTTSPIGRINTRRTEIHIQADRKEAIEAFVQKSYQLYLQELESYQNNDRFMYDVQPYAGNINYTAFKLGEEKTFDNLFSRQSCELLNIVDQFQAKKGKYAIKGYPHKIGLLLSGPPGTGKTSLIKALSHYTNRHIVNIPLNRISTNAQFMKTFFNNQYKDNSGTLLSTNVDFSDVIFVLEDLDAASSVVFKRTMIGSKKKPRKKARDDEKKDTEDEEKEIEVVKKPAPRQVIQRRLVRSSAAAHYAHVHVQSQSSDPVDKLNLSGILNVLDGVVETPGRIVIMTTNHPELLDPALIRPGRIDRHIEMGFMELDDIVNMFHHYCPGCSMSDSEKEDLAKITAVDNDDGMGVTPAVVEQLLAEVDTAEAFLAKLKDRRDVTTTNSSINSSDGGSIEYTETASESSDED